MKRGGLTRLKILAEFAKNQPKVRQSDVAKAVGVSPQAVSRYVTELEEENLLESSGRSRYQVTQEGVEWMSRQARELRGYADSVLGEVVGGQRLWTAVAERDMEEGEEVFLRIKEGLLHATDEESSARGKVVVPGEEGRDVGVEHLEGIVDLKEGEVEVLIVPEIADGGSAGFGGEVGGEGPVGAVGTEALVALRRLGREPDFFFAAEEAAASAAVHGLDVTLLVTRSRLPGVIRTLEEGEVEFDVVD